MERIEGELCFSNASAGALEKVIAQGMVIGEPGGPVEGLAGLRLPI